ncbi:hypothetical protein [Halorubrum sp. FL23]|uniref:hypothetical protein n=1 Tax=Halorubrum sp. FL23 TaxID=3458704 RepID=UPI004034B6E6
MKRRALLGTTIAVSTMLTGCLNSSRTGFILNRVLLSEVSSATRSSDEVEIIIKQNGDEIHSSSHDRPIDQPSERTPVMVDDGFPNERGSIKVTVQSDTDSYETKFDTNIFQDYDGYCIDIHVMLWGDTVSINTFDEPYKCQ